AENDEMALGAVAALKAAGRKPGDVKIVTIDGTKGAVQGILDGWVSGVIESNPRFGPLAFQALEASTAAPAYRRRPSSRTRNTPPRTPRPNWPTRTSEARMTTAALQVRAVSKRFGPVRALDGVSL